MQTKNKQDCPIKYWHDRLNLWMDNYWSLKGWNFDIFDNHLKYEIQNDLKLYKEKQIEPTFFEIVKPNLKNKIVGRIYKYPNVPITEFT